MPPQLNIKKQLAESGESIYINRWWTGLITNRSPLFVPVSALGIQVIARHDTLLDGYNMEITPTMTVRRRPAYSRYCSAVFTSEKPNTFFSFKNTSGTIRNLVDSNLTVSQFTSSAITNLYTKGTTQQTSFKRVGDMLYMVDGTNAKKWDGTTLSGFGIAYPVSAPTLSFAAGTLSPKSGYTYVFVYKNSSTGHISSSSPVSANTGALTSQEIVLGGSYSTDAQVNKIDIYRTKDGGATYYFLAEIANNTLGGTWSYTDSAADTSLNSLLTVNTVHLNDPPPAGASLIEFHRGRNWVAVKNILYFGGGPQITNGVPEECFPPANYFKLPGTITAIKSTTNGLAVWTTDEWYFVLGTDLGNFYVQKYQSNFGVNNQNCVAADGDLIFIFTNNKQLFAFSDSLSEVGFSIRDKLAAFSPSTTSVAVHRNGTDEGLFISNGADTIYRYSLMQQVWCPQATSFGASGIGAINSIEVGSSDYRLMAGRASTGGYLLSRDIGTSFLDDGTTAYSASITVGCIIVSPPGQTSTIRSLMVEFSKITGSAAPTVSILTDEISGSFTSLGAGVNEPPMLPAASSLNVKRYYLKAASVPLPEQMRFLQAQVTFGAQSYADEIYGLALGT